MPSLNIPFLPSKNVKSSSHEDENEEKISEEQKHSKIRKNIIQKIAKTAFDLLSPMITIPPKIFFDNIGVAASNGMIFYFHKTILFASFREFF